MSSRRCLAAAAAAVLLLLPLSGAQADPSVPYLDPLIAELEARSAALEGSVDKDEQKQKKTIDKLLKGFAKESKGPDKDLKAAGKAAKKLAKVFPGEFPDPDMLVAAAIAEDDLANLILQALELFTGDVDALFDAAQDLIDTAPTGCADKAQSALDKVMMIVEEAGEPDPGNLPDYAKALAKGLKKGLKVEAKALQAQDCTPKGGGGGGNLEWYESTATVNGVDYYDDAGESDDDDIAGTNFGNSVFFFVFSDDGLNLSFTVPGATEGVYQNVFVQSYLAPGSLNPVNLVGTVTVTHFPNNPPGHMRADFDFQGQSTSVVGSFAVYVHDPI